MAQKPRVQAPKPRSAPSSGGSAWRRSLLVIGAVLLAGLVAGGVVLAAFGRGGGVDEQSVRAELRAAGCSLQVAKALEGEHSLPADGTADWNTDPPTTGPHFGFDASGKLGTVIWGAYTEPIQLARLVHNTEHGGVYILYGDQVAGDVVDELSSFYERHKNGTLLAPLPKLGDQIALGAWVVDGGDGNGYLAKCRAFDDGAFSSFLEAFQFKGPEQIPGTSLRPGGN